MLLKHYVHKANGFVSTVVSCASGICLTKYFLKPVVEIKRCWVDVFFLNDQLSRVLMLIVILKFNE